ncbi:hypothetical protein E2562_038074 [Oryza meyeriana var. granulata]|uniref:Uncharacterized protein n=1 Tax=Oryza meyeriana var. granulata TaxID=110450 RepID=A0A6G1EU89_9ORYZ|nr:hypothetical protein E2562_038074 [Oryza meyeriana var. granulata]
MVAVTVTRKSRSFVAPLSLPAPAAETPITTLELSAIDRVPGLRHNVRSLHVFRHNGAKPDGDAHTVRPR